VVSARAVLIWAVLGVAIAAPIAVAATSPLLAWRTPVYIASGFAGMAALALLFLQPLLAGGYLPGLPARRGRMVHRWIGAMLLVMIIAHVGGLWLTSPQDVMDALLFDSPTPFSVWGVVAMWTIIGTALLASLRRPLRIGPKIWRIGHTIFAVVIVIGSVVHALLVEGTMGPLSKAAFCALVVVAAAKAIFELRAWALLMRRRPSPTPDA
jgi:predicted ferric reductase